MDQPSSRREHASTDERRDGQHQPASVQSRSRRRRLTAHRHATARNCAAHQTAAGACDGSRCVVRIVRRLHRPARPWRACPEEPHRPVPSSPEVTCARSPGPVRGHPGRSERRGSCVTRPRARPHLPGHRDTVPARRYPAAGLERLHLPFRRGPSNWTWPAGHPRTRRSHARDSFTPDGRGRAGTRATTASAATRRRTLSFLASAEIDPDRARDGHGQVRPSRVPVR